MNPLNDISFSSREDLVLKLRGIFSQSTPGRIDSQPRTSTQFPDFHRNRNKREFADQLMTSEWLVDIPEDFEEWIMVPCPKARRCLIVATNVNN